MDEKIYVTIGSHNLWFYVWEITLTVLTIIAIISISIAIYFYLKSKKKTEKRIETEANIDLPLKWFKFYSEVLMLLIPIVNIIQIFIYIDDYNSLPFGIVFRHLLIQAITYIILPIYLFINIPKYKKSTFIVLIIQIILPQLVALYQTLLYEPYNFVTRLIGAFIVIVPNIIYFYKRRSLFNK